jgi:nitrogen fixation/metabolism regulation signal transduction histidine kinase
MGSAGEQSSGSSQPVGAMGWLGPATAGVGASLAAYLASSADFPAGFVAAATLAGAMGAFITQAWARLPSATGGLERRAGRGTTDASEARQRLLRVVADSVPDAVVLFSEVGTIQYSNPVARDLFFEGQSPEGQNFIRLVSAAAAPLREALLGETDRFFSLEVDGRSESYHLSRRTFVADGEPLTLLVVKYMTREIRRREVEVLQRVVRVISHEVNNSLAPISSLMHSARKMASLVGQAEKFARVFDTIDERASHLRTFLEGYAALARLPPRAWPR